jgi:hypothetical protein
VLLAPVSPNHRHRGACCADAASCQRQYSQKIDNNIHRMTRRSGDSPTVSGICARVNQRVENAISERLEKASMNESRDQDRGKGAIEQDSQNNAVGCHVKDIDAQALFAFRCGVIAWLISNCTAV